MSALREKLLLKIVLPLAEKLNGTCASYWLKQIQEMSTWSREKVAAWQEQKLQLFVRHAYEHTVYYRNLFVELGLKPEDIKDASDLKKLPVLTKDEVRTHYEELIPDDVKHIPHRMDKTGGTSGEPMLYLTDENVWGYVTAAKIYAWTKSNYRYGDKFVALGSSSILDLKPSFKRRVYDIIRGEIGMNSMNMSEDICNKYLTKMKKEHIQYIYGYASSIYLLAKFANNNHIDVSFVRGVFTTSENLTENYRKVIESTFHCRVMDCYGAKDAGIAAYEITPGKYFIGYDVIPEIVDDFGNGEGTLLTTCFLNNAFPLIRYDYGDNAKLVLEDDEYNSAVLTKILGRNSDVIRLDNGNVLTSPGYTILMNKFDVVAYSIQKISGNMIKIQLQPEINKWSEDQERALKTEMNRFLGEGCSLVIDYVDKFEPLKNGKRRFFYNESI